MLWGVVDGKLTFFITFVIGPVFIYCTRNCVLLHEHVDYFLNNIFFTSCQICTHIKGNPFTSLLTCALSDTDNKTVASASM